MSNKLFTKSAFKIATHCPMQAYYYRNPQEYENQSTTDDFLKSMAEGGFQVGELAKIYGEVPPENDLENCAGYDKPLERTKNLWKNENVNIAEAAFRYGDCFVRADVVKKQGHIVELIEVKAKSWDPNDDFVKTPTRGANAGKSVVNSSIRDYLYDVAFQKWVVENALKTDYPEEKFKVRAYLMMADKSKINSIPRLNSLFRVKKRMDDNGEKRAYAEVIPDALEILKKPHEHVLTAFYVDDECRLVIDGKTTEQEEVLGMQFVPFIEKYSKQYVNNEKHYCLLGSKCFKCPFSLSDDGKTKGLKSGYEECWREVAGFKDEDFAKPLIKDLNGTGLTRSPNTKNDWISQRLYFIKDITENVYPRRNDGSENGWSNNDRKWIQIDGTNSGQKEAIIQTDLLRAEMKSWKYPLHMIDFETTNSALPYYEGQRPYEQVAFQFSHHIINKDGSIEHAGQFLETRPGYFPNFNFVRALRDQLNKDEGSVFRYSNHENTILNAIRVQLLASKEKDKDDLIAFIESITHEGKVRKGERDMIDLCDVVKRFYWHPIMKGSNSIKQVLPAILNSGTYLQERYGKPIYGSVIKSLNYTAKNPLVLIVKDKETGDIKNPYKVLPQLQEIQDELIDTIAEQSHGVWDKDELKQYLQNAAADEMDADDDTRINNGGLPLVLFRSFQALDPSVNWEDSLKTSAPSMDAVKYHAVREGLLKYCELDTMAMVFIWEYFAHECGLLK